jgi:ABC-2 type transport system ATP-binding protein
MAPALEIRGLRKSFKTFTLGPIDLTVPAGSIYGFVGANGAGKTTTIDLIFGMGRNDAGTIRALGLDHQRDEVALKRQVGYVSPNFDFGVWKRVGRAVSFVRGFYDTWDQQYCERLLHTFHLDPGDRIATLSFGARTKLAVVLALSWRPRLLVLDEPTIGLDAIARQEVFVELLAAVRDETRAVFISSHAIAELERFADHVGMIHQGQMVFEGAIDDLLERYRMVEFLAGDRFALDPSSGVRVQKHEDERWRVLVDRRTAPDNWLTRPGLAPIADAPVSLEELFVALGRS